MMGPPGQVALAGYIGYSLSGNVDEAAKYWLGPMRYSELTHAPVIMQAAGLMATGVAMEEATVYARTRLTDALSSGNVLFQRLLWDEVGSFMPGRTWIKAEPAVGGEVVGKFKKFVLVGDPEAPLRLGAGSATFEQMTEGLSPIAQGQLKVTFGRGIVAEVVTPNELRPFNQRLVRGAISRSFEIPEENINFITVGSEERAALPVELLTEEEVQALPLDVVTEKFSDFVRRQVETRPPVEPTFDYTANPSEWTYDMLEHATDEQAAHYVSCRGKKSAYSTTGSTGGWYRR
jgi:hypothetical protein